MPLKAKIANKPVLDDKGYCQGVIKSVIETDENVKYRSQFEFNIVAEGTQKSITFKMWTGQSLNDEKFEQEDKTKDYNRFTRLCLQLGLITDKDLSDLSKVDIDIESLEGQEIKFKLVKSRKNPLLSIPDIASIKPLTVEDKK